MNPCNIIYSGFAQAISIYGELESRPPRSISAAVRNLIFKGVMEKTWANLSNIAMATTLTVEGMSCSHCEQTVEEAVENVTGVRDAEADRDAEQVTVNGDADPKELVAVVKDAGYDATA